jgi:hypothetical protein
MEEYAAERVEGLCALRIIPIRAHTGRTRDHAPGAAEFLGSRSGEVPCQNLMKHRIGNRAIGCTRSSVKASRQTGSLSALPGPTETAEASTSCVTLSRSTAAWCSAQPKRREPKPLTIGYVSSTTHFALRAPLKGCGCSLPA